MGTSRVQRQVTEWVHEGYRHRTMNGYKKGTETGHRMGVCGYRQRAMIFFLIFLICKPIP